MEDKGVLRKMMKHIACTSLIVVLILLGLITKSNAGGWLIYYKPEFKGKVLDAETKEPIEGAVVVAVYHKSAIRLAPESISIIKHIRETLTSKDGTFSISAYTSLTDPLSFDFWVTFIIFKPGYGSFPDNQVTPSGIKPVDQEVFFSGELGSEGELRMWEQGEKGPKLKKFNVTFGMVELPELDTVEERRRNIPSLPSYVKFLEDQENLIRLINEEKENIGLQKTDPYKAREHILK